MHMELSRVADIAMRHCLHHQGRYAVPSMSTLSSSAASAGVCHGQTVAASSLGFLSRDVLLLTPHSDTDLRRRLLLFFAVLSSSGAALILPAGPCLRSLAASGIWCPILKRINEPL